MHQREHERGAGLHEAPCIDIPLGDDAVEWRDHALVGLLLTKHADQGLLSRDVCLCNRDRRLLGIEGQAVGVALLRRHPSLLDQVAVAIVGDPRKIPARLRLLQRRLGLVKRGFGLSDLVIELGSRNLRQQIASLYMITDIDLARLDVAVGAGKDVRRRECERRRRQGDGYLAAGSAHLCDANGRDKVPLLLVSSHDLTILRLMLRRAVCDAHRERQQRAQSEQPKATWANGLVT